MISRTFGNVVRRPYWAGLVQRFCQEPPVINQLRRLKVKYDQTESRKTEVRLSASGMNATWTMLHNHQARIPDNLMPRKSATAFSRPIVAMLP